jgi:hypothetical protein
VLFIYLFIETGTYCIVWAGLELVILLFYLPSAGITGMYHHIQHNIVSESNILAIVTPNKEYSNREWCIGQDRTLCCEKHLAQLPSCSKEKPYFFLK